VKYLGAFGRFWWDFIVGDDWSVAAVIAVGLVLTYLLAHRGLNAWWLLPLAVAVVLAHSLWGAARAAVGHASQRRDRGASNGG
jgi:hypothetical protein